MNWLKSELHDFTLIRSLSDIMELRGERDERRLLRFLIAAAPGMPPVWRGEPADQDAILKKARQALAEEGEVSEAARLWLESLFMEDALSLFAATDAALAALGWRWRQQIDMTQRAWEVAREQHHHWRSRFSPKPGGDSSEVNFDAAMYGWNAGMRLPKRLTWHGPVLLSLCDPEFCRAMRADVEQALADFAESAPWFVNLVKKWQTPDASVMPEKQTALLLTAWRLREVTRESAQFEHERRKIAQKKRESGITTWRQAFGRIMENFGALGNADGGEARQEWRRALGDLYDLSERLASAHYTEESFLRLRRQVSAIERLAFSLENALDALELREEHLGIFLQPRRLSWVGGSILLFAALISVTYALPAAIIGMGGFIALHFRRRARARRDLSVQIQLFRRALSSFAKANATLQADGRDSN